MKCPVCGGAELISDTRDLPFTYKGETTLIKDITGDFCPCCAEGVLDIEQAKHMGASIDVFMKQVNASIIDPNFISTIRKKLSLDQKEAGEIFGGGINAFSRYETGKTKPPVALIKLLKVLDKHPDLLEEVRVG